MPADKAKKYVESVKQSMQKKVSYDPNTGMTSGQPEVMCIRKNTEIPLLDGRHLTLEECIEEFKNGKENWVYSINKSSGQVEPGKTS